MTNSKTVNNEILDMKVVSKESKKTNVALIVIVYFVVTTVIALLVA